MKLYFNAASPFVRKVMIILHETGQTDRVEIVQAGGSALDSSKMPVAENPLAKLPTLVADDGRALYDSRVICRYLDDRFNAGLYGSGDALWDNLVIEATADGLMEAALLMVYEGRVRPVDKQFQPWVEGQWAKAERALAVLNTDWIGVLSGPFGIAHVAVASALGYLDLRHSARNWRAANPALADWFAAISGRDSIRATIPAG